MGMAMGMAMMEMKMVGGMMVVWEVMAAEEMVVMAESARAVSGDNDGVAR